MSLYPVDIEPCLSFYCPLNPGSGKFIAPWDSVNLGPSVSVLLRDAADPGSGNMLLTFTRMGNGHQHPHPSGFRK